MTTLTPRRVTTLPPIDMDELRSGMSNATGTGVKELEPASGEWDYESTHGDHPALLAWDDMIEEVIAELAPDVARMLTEAVEKRLPWTWEPER